LSELSDKAIQAIQDAVTTTVILVGGEEFTARQIFTPPEAPQPAAMAVNTLRGVVDYLESNIDALDPVSTVVHVVSESCVAIRSKIARKDNKRDKWVEATYTSIFSKAFTFGNFMERESFNIALQTLFLKTDDRDALLTLIGNMKEQKVKEFSDDGRTQEILTRKGRASVGEVEVPNPVMLAPFRTFPEIDQPASPFILRISSSDADDVPKCCLFEADGGAWKLQAIEWIREWLQREIDQRALKFPIIA
jgi:hypothetical protein